MNPPVATQRIMYAVARRVGLEPVGDDANLSESKAREIMGFIDERLREGWESYDFVETTLVEQRAFANDYDPTLCYNTGDIVWDWSSNSYYQALAPTIGGTLSNPAVWQPNVNPPYPRSIPWWQTGHTQIGTCFSAWNKCFCNRNFKRDGFVFEKEESPPSSISVIIPVYNGEKHVEKCLNSYLKVS